MTDYFSEYSSFIGNKGLPSPADTPYETPSFIRSKRSSRATAGSSREQSVSPPPLPPDAAETWDKTRDGRYTALDPRRFTPSLHAQLVSDILSLRRELDSKNNLVENLETTLSTTKDENDSLAEQIAQYVKEVRKAKLQVQQMEQGTFDAVEGLAKERDLAKNTADELKNKLDAAQKFARRQDEDAERTQRIWESEKQSWDDERRQLERRVHVTETRLKTFVDEMSAQQAALEEHQTQGDDLDESQFKDSGLGNESDTASVRSSSTPVKHRRNRSSLSSRTKSIRSSYPARAAGTPEPHSKPNGYSLADELGIDEEDEYDMDEFEHPDEELEYSEHLRKTMDSRQSGRYSALGDSESKAKRILGLTSESVDAPAPSPTKKDFPKRSMDSVATSDGTKQSFEHVAHLPTVPEIQSTPTVHYVDKGYQPSPPPSPARDVMTPEKMSIPTIEETPPREDMQHISGSPKRRSMLGVSTQVAASPISPPDTPVNGSTPWSVDANNASPKDYTTASTQTDIVGLEPAKGHMPKRDSLSPPDYVPSIAIHPSSRPSSPRRYVLPPGTKNASTQANLSWRSRDAGVQTENIRVDKRPVKLPPHLLPGHLLPSPTFQEPPPPLNNSKLARTTSTAKKFTKKLPLIKSPVSPPLQSPVESSPEKSRENSEANLRALPLRAIPLPRPVLSPPLDHGDFTQGPLNRSSQYGVTKSGQASSPLLDLEKDLEISDTEEPQGDFDPKDLTGSIPALSRPPHGRFGLSEPPKAVPEDKEISPERRPGTADSYGAAPAPSVASSRANSQRARTKPPAKLNAYKDIRSRSPSFGSVASSSYTTQSAAVVPPFPIPTRSSSRVIPNSHSEGSQSPTPYHADVFGNRQRLQRGQGNKGSLRKVQSAAVIRHPGRKGSPKKSRHRRHSPDLTPVQSMAFDSPAPTRFPIPGLPTPQRDGVSFDYVKGSVDLTKAAPDSVPSPRVSEETNLVDAIAATMVGEWMWKYIRKRKSFGVQEDFPVAQDGTVNTSTHGSRHKRWVWLSPYERTIMWDTKQPANGNALLGKKGRKLDIQSVLDVVDDTPLPKGAELGAAHSRSILILTPQRALKFTTVSAERHALWMTALAFLAQSGRLPAQIPQVPTPHLPQMAAHAPPPIPTHEPPAVKRHRSPSFGRANVRDSIRLAKGKRPELPNSISQPDTGRGDAMMALEGGPASESADFPAVPRLYISTSRHQRKRSNTSPRLPGSLNGFRSFSSSAVPSTASSALHPGSTAGSSFRPNLPSASSKSGSRDNSIASPDRPNFFEAVGTVRMEAFVDPNVKDGVLYVPAPPPAGGPRPMRRRKDSDMSVTSSLDKRRNGHVFDEYGNDPFRGF